MARVQLKDISRVWGSSVGLKTMSLDIADGEFLVLLGPSGCGKTTTMRIVAGLEDTSSGEIWIGDRCVNNLEPKDRDVAMVFQSYALYPHMTVAENMSFALSLTKTPKAEIARRVADAAKILAIEPLLDRKPKALSGGQRQRVAMGRAIVREPAVFLFDEPLSNLDAKLRAQMRVELAVLHKRLGKTTVYVTHDQIEAMTLADRIVILDRGVIQQIGTPEQVFNEPRNLFVAGFIGSPGMNLLPAMSDGQGGAKLVAGGAMIASNSLSQCASGAAVVVGIRPQGLRISDDGRLAMNVTVAEYLGTETVLTGQLVGSEQSVTAVVSGNQSACVGTQISLAVDAAHVHVFDAATQMNLRGDASE